MGHHDGHGRRAAQAYRRRLTEMERLENIRGGGFSLFVVGGGEPPQERVGHVGAGLLDHQERCARVLLSLPMPPEDSLSVDAVDSLFYNELDTSAVAENDPWSSNLEYMFWRRGPPRWHVALWGMPRDLRDPMERLAGYEIGLRRPLARLWLSDPAARFSDDVLRWGFASAVWAAQYSAGELDYGSAHYILPACLACGQPTGSYCDGVAGHCGRALCTQCCARFDDIGPCCRRLRWPRAADP
jgi:hypothetical protein